jgi:signal transduction histidine kinase
LASLLALMLALPGLAWTADTGPATTRVLVVHSFGRDFAPFGATTAAFRREFAMRQPGRVIFLEATLDAGRPLGPTEEASFASYLKTRYSEPRPDLIVGVGGIAATFLFKYRDAEFPGVPMLLASVDARFAQRERMRPGDAMAATNIDIPRIFDNMLGLRPDIRTIALVIGDSTLEQSWQRWFVEASAGLPDSVRLVSYGGLSLEEMTRRVAALPPDAAVIYTHVLVDGAGVPHERLEALAAILQSTSVPVFSAFGKEIGLGVAGGPYIDEDSAGREAARLAVQQLAGGPPADPIVTRLDMSAPVYDARALARWDIPESRLPAGSEVRFRPVPVWVEHRTAFVVGLAVVLTQALLIGALLIQRARRRRAEQDARSLGGRLITAHEDEGRRLARELHDDVTQRLAGLSIEATVLERSRDPAQQAAARSISAELADLSRDVHAMSYRLHPSVLDDLGLEQALRTECDRIAARGDVDVEFRSDLGEQRLPSDAALCLFRVAQESLRNAARHAEARRIEVFVERDARGATLSVLDDGKGYDPSRRRDHASLGVASMRERVALLGGRLSIRSRPGQGTRVTAWIPLRGT